MNSICCHSLFLFPWGKTHPEVIRVRAVNIHVDKGEVVCLLGPNGAGKSTLLKILAGTNKATRGGVSSPKGTVIAYLPQHLLTEDNCTVFEETSKAFQSIFDMKNELITI